MMMTTTSRFAARPPVRCAVHPAEVSPWRCTRCQRQLCPTCAAAVTVRGVALVRCVHCRGDAVPLLVERPLTPTPLALLDFVRSMGTPEGGIQLAAIAVFLLVIGLLPLLGGLLAFATVAAFELLVVRSTAYGGERLPDFTDFDEAGGLRGTLYRFLLGTWLIWIPVALYSHLAHGSLFAAFGPAAEDDPVFLVLTVLGLAYFPAVVIVAAITQSALAMLNPVATFGIILRVPGEYVRTFGFWAALQVGGAVLGSLVYAALDLLPVPLLPSLTAAVLRLAVAAASGFVLGRLIFRHGVDFGLLRPEETRVPVVPGAQPVGTLAAEPSPLDLADPEDVALDLVPADADDAALAEALEARDDRAALAHWHALASRGVTPTLAQPLALRMARLLAGEGLGREAAVLCRTLAHQDLGTGEAGDAMVLYARMLLAHAGPEGLAQARSILEEVRRGYEALPCAAEAAEVLSELSGPAA